MNETTPNKVAKKATTSAEYIEKLIAASGEAYTAKDAEQFGAAAVAAAQALAIVTALRNEQGVK